MLIFTCTAVSFAHGGNDGQKGMGLIMLILIGCAPTAYALNRTLPESAMPAFVRSAQVAATAYAAHGTPGALSVDRAREAVVDGVRTKAIDKPEVYAGLSVLSRDIGERIEDYGTFSRVPAAVVPNLRNDMYLVLDTTRMVTKSEGAKQRFTAAEIESLNGYSASLERGTRYIPLWVKVTVALALGLGTMVGWRRIVVTVGERIGKTHLTYGMGAAAELVTAATIFGAEYIGRPVSTTHILTSGVAGASVANGAGLQFRTIRNMLLAWVLTLPAAMLLSGTLYWLLLQFAGAVAG